MTWRMRRNRGARSCDARATHDSQQLGASSEPARHQTVSDRPVALSRQFWPPALCQNLPFRLLLFGLPRLRHFTGCFALLKGACRATLGSGLGCGSTRLCVQCSGAGTRERGILVTQLAGDPTPSLPSVDGQASLVNSRRLSTRTRSRRNPALLCRCLPSSAVKPRLVQCHPYNLPAMI